MQEYYFNPTLDWLHDCALTTIHWLSIIIIAVYVSHENNNNNNNCNA